MNNLKLVVKPSQMKRKLYAVYSNQLSAMNYKGEKQEH